ncbi:serine/threonine-protein kinase [Actinomadura macrotermitis]|uniref:Serine/threonine-protein kinase PknD n=1 Tax=Actinomadura macrotermitis TaxID=2585200 RepID=A0A7K0BTF9_9ACTN|nr:Serine/threonine-protein kinase PknD [Actinomadura macrotermitis]
MQAEQESWLSGAQPLTADDPPAIGTYRLLGRLGEGGMGAVYLGLAPDGRRVAIKVIRPELAAGPSFRARFDSEVANAQRVASFCTARVIEHGEAGGAPYLVTEYIDGPSLEDHIAARGPLPPGPLRSLAVGVATALTAIHAVRLVHRDLKPRNVMLAADGPRVIDFGIARALDSDERHTQTGGVVGSPGWIAPEQLFDGLAGTAVDVFAWGTLVAYAATGRHPYGTGNLATLAGRAQQGHYDLTGVPGELQALVRAALEPDPRRRPSAEQLLTGLVGTHDTQRAATAIVHAGWAAAPLTAPAAADGAPAAPSSRRRTWLLAGAAGAAVAVLSAGTAWGVTALRSDDKPARKAPPAVAASPDPAKAGFTKVEGVCALVQQQLIDALVPVERHGPLLKDPVDAATGDGRAIGCVWTSQNQAGARIQQARSLHIKIVLRTDGTGRDGVMKAGSDFAEGRRQVASSANTTKKGAVYGPLIPLAGIGDESYVATKQGPLNNALFGNAILRFRLANLHVELIYGGTDAPAAPKSIKQTKPLSMDDARQGVEQVARQAAAALIACAPCHA